MTPLATGQCWRYHSDEPGLDGSRLIVGAVLTFAAGPTLVCCAAVGAIGKRPDGALERITIPFLPMTEAAALASISTSDGIADLPAGFQAQFEAWRSDLRGLTYFTVPFEGRLDRMIARQMAEMIGADTSAA